MPIRDYSFIRKAGIFYKYLAKRAQGEVLFINLEVTKRCNARCNICNYWRTSDHSELNDYLPIIARINPAIVSFTGGEPLLRRDIFDLIRRIREKSVFVYLILVTNGALLNLEKAEKLRRAGIDQLSISLDFLDERHDNARGITGLYQHLSNLIPRLSPLGFDNISLNTVIMDCNLDQILSMAEQAFKWKVNVAYSTYAKIKTGVGSFVVKGAKLKELKKITDKLVQSKSSLRNIANSDHYLRGIPLFFKKGGLPGCFAGHRWVQITPDGFVKPCSELPPICHYKDYFFSLEAVSCESCWFSCRGEAEATLSFQRLKEVLKARKWL